MVRRIRRRTLSTAGQVAARRIAGALACGWGRGWVWTRSGAVDVAGEQSAKAVGRRSTSTAPAVAPSLKRMQHKEHAGETQKGEIRLAAFVSAAGRPRRNVRDDK